MRIPKRAFALAIGLAAAPGTAHSPLDSRPAEIRYLSNDAPFVIFGVSPRSLTGSPYRFDDITLTYVATDALRQVQVFPYVRSARDGSARMAKAVACGAMEAGSRSCAVPVRDLLLQLEGGEGVFGLRIEALGLENDRSTVLVNLPVKLTAARAP